MNVLYLAHRLPYPPNKGDRIRTWHTLRHLAARHRVWCACLADEPIRETDRAALGALCAEVIAVPHAGALRKLTALASLLVDETATEGYHANRRLRQALHRLAQRVRFDAVIAFSACMAQYALRVPARRRVLDLCDLDSRKWQALARGRTSLRHRLLAREARLLQLRELQLYRRFDATLLISEAEAASWPARARRKLHIVGNGVEPPSKIHPLRSTGVVGFVGDMRYPPNDEAVRWFARQVWPEVRRHRPDAIFRIIGRAPSPQVRQLADQPGIDVTGAVDSVTAEIAHCQLMVAPLRVARGLQNKVLEAMAHGRPVVCTTSAAAGIASPRDDVLHVADTPTAWVRAITELLADKQRGAALADRGQHFVSRRFTWSRQLAPLLDLLDPVQAPTCRAASLAPGDQAEPTNPVAVAAALT